MTRSSTEIIAFLAWVFLRQLVGKSPVSLEAATIFLKVMKSKKMIGQKLNKATTLDLDGENDDELECRF